MTVEERRPADKRGSVTALVPLDHARKELGIGRSSAYMLARDKGELMMGLPVFRIGGVWKVSRAQLDRIVAGDIPTAGDGMTANAPKYGSGRPVK